MSNFDPKVYLDVYSEDLLPFYKEKIKKDLQTGEEDFLKKINEKYRRSYTDFGDFSPEEFAQYHAGIYGEGEGRLTTNRYVQAYNKRPEEKANRSNSGYYNWEGKTLGNAFRDVDTRIDISDDEKARIKGQLAEQYYKQGPDLATFETMLKKLTGSKMEQKGQELAARRGDIYAGGLANMMGNF